jgi:quercetin dioxygenase-like cupin family protein
MAGDFQIVPVAPPAGDAVRVSNLLLPATAGPYVLLDGGGERFGGNTFYAKNANTGGQFLFIMTEGGGGPGIGAHFHARHTEDFFALDGETLGWAHGKAVALKPGDFFQAPPRHLHGFKMTQPYNRFVGFLTPGIFENFFTRGQPGRNGVGGRGAGEGAPPQERRGPPPAAGAATAAPADRNAMFRALSMSARGPDGYPLDVHGAKLPLPPQDPVWLEQRVGALQERSLLLQHALMCAGRGDPEAALSAELRAALALKPRAEDFV